MEFDHRKREASTGFDASRSAPVPGKQTLAQALIQFHPAAAPAPARAEITAAPFVPASGPRATLQTLFGDRRAADHVHAAAARGTATAATQLPHREQIQRSFGKHDITSVKGHVGAEAAASAQEMGAAAYATGNHVVLGADADLHTVAHEAAHVVQQRGGVQLAGGVGVTGDAHEQHADAVADLVVHGRSAEALLDRYAGGSVAAASPGAVQCFGAKPTTRDQNPWELYLQQVISELTEYIATCDPSKLNRADVTTTADARKALGEIAARKDCEWFIATSNPAHQVLYPLYQRVVKLKETASKIKQSHMVNKAITTPTMSARTLTGEESDALAKLDKPLGVLLAHDAQSARRIMDVLQLLVEAQQASAAFVRLIGHVLDECVIYQPCMKGLDEHLVKISQQNDVSGYQGFISELQTVCDLAKDGKIGPMNKARIGKLISRTNLWGKKDSGRQDIDVKYRNSLGQIELVEVKDECLTLSIKMNKEIGTDAQLGRDPKASRQLESLKQVRDEHASGNCRLTFWCSQPRGWIRLLCSDNGKKLIDSNCDLVVSGNRYDPGALTVLRGKALKLVEVEQTTNGTALEDAYWAVERKFQRPEAL